MFNNNIQNATTTWEQWNTLPQGAMSSLNPHVEANGKRTRAERVAIVSFGTRALAIRLDMGHHMFNSIGAWFYRYLAGIELNGLRTITIYLRMSYAPQLLTHIQAEVVTIEGPGKVEWSRMSENILSLSISIPNNMDALVTFDRLMKKRQYMKLLCDNEIIWIRDEMNDQLYLLNKVRGLNDLNENILTNTISIRVSSGQYTFVAY